ncbi:Inner membrane protein YihN [bioreactor metagenome]|uniref:Inner membrane protein YihN n=1 Tax=bioreactor metagenome TaxID=1076179 RepID=A0A645GUS4_9ZZZZ
MAGIGAGIIADKFKSRLIFLVYVLIAIIVCAVATPFLSNLVTIAIIVTMILSLMYFMMKSVYFSIMGESGIPVAMTGIASGIVSFIGFIPDAFITSLMGSWLDKDPVTGFNMIFAWIAIWGVIAIVLALVIYKRGKKDKLIHEK